MKILGTGLSGLVGTRIIELLGNKYEFEDLSLDTGFDITSKESVFQKISSSGASLVLHLAAKTDVDGCEKDKALGENGDAWKVNVLGTQNIIEACESSDKKLIYISTDFVFGGDTKKGFYTEEDIPNPINWYAMTKYEGEKRVQKSNLKWTIVRLAYPYRAKFEIKKDFLRAIIEKLENKEKLQALTDHIFTPTFIDDFAFAIDFLLSSSQTGIFHAVGSQSLTPYDAALKIADAFNLNKSLIYKTTREAYFKDRASRPFCLALKDDKIGKLGIRMRTFEEGLREIKKQMFH